MASSGVADRVRALVEEPLGTIGLSLWDVAYVKEGASFYLRVFIDKEGGVDINDCTEASHLLDPLLDEYDPVPTAYIFEVCSPGINRALTRPEHFTASLGKTVQVLLIRPREGKREFIGTLAGYDGAVTLTDPSGETLAFEKQEIAHIYLWEE